MKTSFSRSIISGKRKENFFLISCFKVGRERESRPRKAKKQEPKPVLRISYFFRKTLFKNILVSEKKLHFGSFEN